MTEKSRKGGLGEKFASGYLEAHGYTIKAKNFHSRYGEIDIIAVKDVYIIFAEVKTRKENSMITPAQAVDITKQRKIILTAQDYLIKNECVLQPRFDIMEIYLRSGMPFKCVHIENAFQCDGMDF